MKKFRLNINGIEVLGIPGQTILEVAKDNGVYIPTLCYDERTEIYGACGICVVEVEGNPKMVKACATEIANGMVVKTDTERVKESRKTNLELLLSNHIGDCRPPCALACPAQTDCQGYVGLIANGEFEEAIKLIKNKIPLPGAIGRVCPHPCEDACRRKLVDEPISIQWLKRFASDADIFGEDPFMPDMEPDTGKSVAIAGGGPMGLSAAYYLRKQGHDVTIFEAMPNAGGMLRYGIPEYRLPKALLDEEIELIERMGVDIRTNQKIGVDVTFDSIRRNYDAVILGIGAWRSTDLGCAGEDAEGVIGGIDFLRKVVRNEEIKLGKNVAIVGGGNTAMDACRTAVRLGVENVYNVYRRTKDEMPADRVEIEEAEEEGVIFNNLTNPIEIIKDENGHVKQMKLQVMELGEPDASGRRSPKPVEGKTETIDVDNVIVAIGQAVDPAGFEGLELTRKNGIVGDNDTFMTNLEGVFVGGDCYNDKITIAIEAIGHSKKIADIVDAYLEGVKIKYEKPFVVERDDLTEESFEDRERKCRPEMEQLDPEGRKDNFTEVVMGYTEEQAMAEAGRCLECGCHDYFECKLIDLSNEYDVKPERMAGDVNKIEFDDDHPFILRDPNKCILCGLCVRACDEVMGIGALGLVDRGFDTVVKPSLEKPLAESGCVSCGQCVSVCPTGALQEKITNIKPIPLDTDETLSTCSFCSVGCSVKLETCGDLMIKSVPDKNGAVNKGLLCGKGRFGFDGAVAGEKLLEPVIRKNGETTEADYHDAFVYTAKKVQGIRTKYGKEAVAVAVSDRYTNEEAYVIKEFSNSIGARTICLNNRKSGIEKVLGVDASPNTIDELLSTEVILLMGFVEKMNPVISLKISQAVKNGAKVYNINPGNDKVYGHAEKTIDVSNDLSFLKEMAKALIDMGKTPKADNFDEVKQSLADVKAGAEAQEIAEIYSKAKKAMIVFTQNAITEDAATWIANIAVLSGHIGKARDGILQVKSKNNSQGLVDLGITEGVCGLDGVKALLVFGEDTTADLSGLEFLMVSDTHMTATAAKAEVVIPGSSYASTYGTFTNTERRLQMVVQAISEEVLYSNWEIASELSHVFENDMPYDSVDDIMEEMERTLPHYRCTDIGEVSGGILCQNGQFSLQTTGDSAFADVLPNTDQLMNRIDTLLPKPVK